MASNGNQITQGMAAGARALLNAENAFHFQKQLYDNTDMGTEIYEAVLIDPEANSYLGLTCGEIYNAAQSFAAFQAWLDDNNGEHRRNLSNIISVSNLGG